MRNWWIQLNPRDRNALLLALVCLLGFAVYSALNKLNQTNHQLSQALEEQGKTLAWMQGAAKIIRQQGPRPKGKSPQGSLLSAVDQSARSIGLGSALKRVQPDGEGVRLWLERADFDTLLLWFETLQRDHQARPATLHIEPLDRPGQVNARLTISRG